MSMLDAPLLAGQPGIQRLPRRDLTLFVKKGFLDSDECAGLIDRIEANRRPSTIADDLGYEAFRTSETCDLEDSDPFVAAINAKLAAYSGIDPAQGEQLQGQRYAVGQEFKAHTDYFEPGGMDFERYCGRSGNRTWTLMVYLNQPAAGGATRFTQVDKMIQPETGKLVAWNNRLPDGTMNPATIHHGMKVRSGVKYIITKWYRERIWAG
ncbi:prolyl 4-hydroxylase [Sphingobium sp. B1D7B]|uniref:prolyl hydroxylase family protein n=1 Tax=Sphingobium TaxID=165695 RepID=UPI0015EC6B46|nr:MULTISPECIES: 2OG-Fe(II) oxygenase [Sphingobium]MCW2364429.1 prolyl 4-hydroxylase [Sphingobium sp. B10D3B]MCW2382412.1 prolyl 4-hydroxylase [Sphingobium sp. B2D3B]MCW2387384.1 prolyl 4-hydroxylase [Sphingobium sp. B11D3B]MCW2391433.1 prolyl 4-hydroxylase [Sphingobium sp. B11D3A]MCW2397415.1 prolyl 4-hydroxylase [Sphingobium sp. B2D3C]